MSIRLRLLVVLFKKNLFNLLYVRSSAADMGERASELLGFRIADQSNMPKMKELSLYSLNAMVQARG